MFRSFVSRRSASKAVAQAVSFETMESRQLLSGSLPLLVTGTDGADTITVQRISLSSGYAHQWNVNVNGHKTEYYNGEFSNILIYGFGGNDTITVTKMDIFTPFTINGGAGDDKIYLGDGTLEHNSAPANISVIGGGGSDTLTVDASLAKTYERDRYQLSDGHLIAGTWSVDMKKFIDIPDIAFSGLTSLNVFTPNQPADIYANYVQSGLNATFFTGSAATNVNVGGGDVAANVRGQLSILGSGAAVTLDDHQAAGDNIYVVDRGSISKLGKPAVYFAGVDQVILNASPGDDTVLVRGTNGGYRYTLNGNGGNDTFNVGDGNLTKNIAGSLKIVGGAGNDAVNYGDYEQALGGSYTLRSTSLTKSGSLTTSTSGVENIALGLGDQSDTATVFPDKVNFHVSGNGGADKLNVALGGVSGTKLVTSDATSGAYTFSNANPVSFDGFESFTELGGGGGQPSGATISGMIFNDLDGDGKKDPNEVGLANRTVWIDLDNDKKIDANEKSTVTDANGAFSLTGLVAGTYKVRQMLPSGWSQTTPSNGYGINVTVSADQTSGGHLFGEKKI